MNNLTFIYVVGGEDKHYTNLQRSINSVKKIYPQSKILVGDFDKKIKDSKKDNISVVDLSHVKIDKKKTFKHIIWQYKFYVCLKTKSKYNLYLDTDTVLVNPINELISEAKGRFTIAKHFWIPTIKDFKAKAETCVETSDYFDTLNLKDEMDFCAAGVFFFENNEANFKIIKSTFKIHESIYENKDYILGVYDEPILNSVLQKNKKQTLYYNGSLNHCSMKNMPIEFKNGKLYGKNEFDSDFKKIICLHCDFFRRDPSSGYNEPVKSLIYNLFNTV
tara:strand:+ start:1987 stop:2814 length:828 start_codon:yes stop_codon:yes gene_type:complete